MDHFTQGDWFFLTVLAFSAVFCLFLAMRMFHRARLIEDLPTSKIRSCPQGYVELHGTAKWVEGPEIKAPLSGLPCVWYSFIVEEYAQHSKQKWRHVNSGVSDELFLLEDDTGECLIDPEGAEVTPSTKSTWYGKKRLGPAIHSSPLDVLSRSVFQTGQRYRYTENRLDVYESLYAIGEFNSIGTDYRQDIKTAALERLRDLKQDKEKLAKYDTNNDGHVDAEEWEQARQDAKQAAIEEQLAKPLAKRTHILRKPKTKKFQPFLLSSKTETQMTRRNRIYSIALSSLFVALIVAIFFKISGTF